MYFSKLLIADIIEYATSRGADQQDLHQSIGDNENIDPKEHVSYEKMVAVLNIAGQSINDEHLGLHLGEQLILKGTSQVDTIMQHSPTIEEAFSNAVVYGRLISDALTSEMTKTKHYTKVSFTINPNWAVYQNHAVQQIIDMTLVCTLKSIYWLTAAKHTPVEVHLNYPSVKIKREYYRVFNCPVKFNALSPGIIFHNPILNQSVAFSNSGLLEHLKEIADKEMGNIQTEDRIIISIKESILSNLPNRSSMDEVASTLLMSGRTMQRKLSFLNTTFKKVERDIVLQLAKKLIRYEQRTIEEISYLLGFSEASSFIRFFKKEEKVTPKKYRRSK